MLGLGLGRFLPPGAKKLVISAEHLVREWAPLPALFPAGRGAMAFSGRQVVVAGLFSTRSGLGRGAQLFAEDYRQRGIPVRKVDLSAALDLPMDHPDGEALTPAEAAGLDGDLVVVLNPPLYVTAVRMFDRAWIARRCVVAHWVWEVDRLPRAWMRAALWCDELWAPSPFVAGTLRAGLAARHGKRCPTIRCVPYPVDCLSPSPPTPDGRRRARGALGVAESDFCVGYSFSSASNYTRKNPEALVAAFQDAFPPGRTGIVLAMRCLDLEAYPPGARRLRAMAAADPRIRLFDGVAATAPIGDLYRAIDVYAAPFRSEGYGLNIVEASQHGVDVLASEWSLDPEIAARPGVETVPCRLVPVVDPQGNYPASLGARWAEPDIAAMAERLRALERRARTRPGL